MLKLDKILDGLLGTLVLTALVACGGGSGGGSPSASSPPTPTTWTVGGTVTGLASGQQITLLNNGGGALVVNTNGNFTFGTPVAAGAAYQVTVSATSTGLTCTVTNPSGSNISANVTNVDVNCVVSPPPIPSANYVTASVAVNQAAPGPTLNTSFVGLSYEKSKMIQPVLSGTDTVLVTMMSKLGPGVLRIGGNSVNTTTWNANGIGSTTGEIAPADIDKVASLLAATGWKVIYGMNHVTNTPANIASEAQYAAQKFGSSLLAFEIGNEPDLYHTGARPSTYTFADFLAEWQAYCSAIIAVVPNAVFSGPAAAYNVSGYTVPFAQNAGAQIQLLTQHYYRANGQLATSTLALLLAGDTSLPGELQTLNTAASTAHLANGYRLAEANSFYNGGAPNISDAYGTSLWLLDFLFTNAINGSSGVNLHGGGTGPYTPITDDGNVANGPRPEYYGLLMFSMLDQGLVLPTTTTVSGINFTAYAVGQTDGSTMVLLNNKDATNSAYTTIQLNKTASTATLTTLTGTNLSATSGFTLNGTVIGNDGIWNAGTPNIVYFQPNGMLTLNVPPMTAILVHAQ